MRGHAMRAARRGHLICLVATAAGLSVPAAAATAEAAPTAPAVAEVVRSRSADLPLSGQLSTDSERVGVTGRLRITVLTRTKPGGGGTVLVVSALRGTTGTAHAGLGTYHFCGVATDTLAFPAVPAEPLTLFPEFTAFPPDPTALPYPIRPARLLVTVTGAGDITALAASVHDPRP